MTLEKDAAKLIALDMLKDRSVSTRDNRYIRASSIGQCKRQVGYSLLGYQGLPVDGLGTFTFDQGSALHLMIQKRLVSLGWIKAKPVIKFTKDSWYMDWEQTDDPNSGCELPIENHDLRIIGHCDGITVPLSKRIENKIEGYYPDPEGERYLIEIKSITDKSRFWALAIRDGGINQINEEDFKTEFIELDYELTSTGNKAQKFSRFQHSRKVRSAYGVKDQPVYKLKIEGKDELVTILMAGNSAGSFTNLQKPKPEHIMQASLYANQLGLDKILFIYLGKDVDNNLYKEDLLNTPIKIFEHVVDELDIDIIKNKVETIYSYTDERKLPPRDYEYGEDKSPCKWCSHRHLCYPDKIDIEPINKQLIELELEPLSLESGKVHKYKKSLKSEYKKRKVE